MLSKLAITIVIYTTAKCDEKRLNQKNSKFSKKFKIFQKNFQKNFSRKFFKKIFKKNFQKNFQKKFSKKIFKKKYHVLTIVKNQQHDLRNISVKCSNIINSTLKKSNYKFSKNI